MRVFEADGYNPEYSMLVLRDPAGYEPAGPDPDDREPAGTFAGAGIGWLSALTNGRSDALRLEAHDDRPPAGEPGFDDVLETPFHAITGRLSLTFMTAGTDGPVHLELGGGGTYRVRVARRAGDAGGDRWLLQFWPDPSPAPPVWQVRSRPAERGGNDGWSSELPGPVMDVSRIIGATAVALGRAVSVDDVDEWTRAHRRHPSEWLDAPLWRLPREPQATGHADRDRLLTAQHAKTLAWIAGMQRRLDDIAAELGVPPVRGKRDVVPLLAAAGLLVSDDAGRYSVGRPQRVDTVLSLRPERVRIVRASDARSRYQELAQDVAAVLRWTSRAELDTTPAELAERLLVPEAQLRDVLDYAEQTGMLHTDRGPRLRLRPGPRPPVEPTGAKRPSEPVLPIGAPPRTGVVTADGLVVVWRDGDRIELAHLGAAPWTRALETAYGMLILSDDRFPRLVGPTGDVRILDRTIPLDAALLGDGRRLAMADGSHRLRLVDLSGARPDTQPWPTDQPVTLHGIHRDTIYFTELRTRTTLRWTPDSEPQPCGHPVEHVDPYSGTFSWLTPRGVMVARPPGSAVDLSVDQRVRLAPGGDHVWLVTSPPATLTLWPVEPGPEVRSWALPWPDDDTPDPIWEDAGHLLVTGPTERVDGELISGLRLSVRDGTLERLPGAGPTGQTLLLSEPWVTTSES
ncbi:DUF6042 family protein [Actinoplanes sp. M2I2]|uniref:DUF6042 family protein n=1 Tax=Actinoplanes sp. M2I2 TaxID=1734444 RepID=UPI002021D94A|nr:DUF6042 family protein [Actinoplanes sp. M2I2]